MQIVELPIEEFLQTSIKEARNEGFLWIMILLAREIEAENSYEQLRKCWSSFDNLTNKEILFMFSVAGEKKSEVGDCLPKKNSLGEIIFNPFLRIMNSLLPSLREKQNITNAENIKLLEKVLKGNTNHVSELCARLDVKEESVPAIVLINTFNEKKIVLPLAEDDLYISIKKFICAISSELKAYNDLIDKRHSIRDEIENIDYKIQNSSIPKYAKDYYKAKGRLEEIIAKEPEGIDANALKAAIENNNISAKKQFPKEIGNDLNRVINLKKDHKDLEKYASLDKITEARKKLEEDKLQKERMVENLDNQLAEIKERLDSDVEMYAKKEMRRNVPKMNNSPILIVTANDNETDAFLKDRSFINYIKGNNTNDKNFYNVGKLFGYDVVHFQIPVQGSIKETGSLLSIDHAIKEFMPCAVILLGIAFGVDEKKQKIGDILISERIIDYESGKISQGSFRSDADIPGAGGKLFSACKRLGHDWNNKTSGPKVICGNIVSGDKVINNKSFRDSIPTGNHTIIGGEMEGRGLYAACKDNNISEWIIIKSICDWGYNKDGNKEKNQKKAAKNAANFVIQLLEKGLL